MGALSNNGGGYYGSTILASQNNGHPDDKIAFAVGAGIKINFPMIGPGDYLQAQVNYNRKARRVTLNDPGKCWLARPLRGGDRLGVGWFSDAVYCGHFGNCGRHRL